jgi:glycosyltransferase involved in cell wall biosynthesis
MHDDKKPRICVWFKKSDNPWGGGNQFLAALASELKSNGYVVSDHPSQNTPVVLVNSHNLGAGTLIRPRRLLAVLGRRSFRRTVTSLLGLPSPAVPAFIHRLDGVASLIRGRRTQADGIVEAINPYSDVTIFQSHYSRGAYYQAGVRPPRWNVIHNGVDTSIFRPTLSYRPPGSVLRLLAVSWSPNRTKGFELLRNLSLHPNTELRFVGRWCDGIDPGRTVLLGVRSSNEIAQLLRESDVFVHAGENEACSNAILEALASAIPVLYRDSGGNRELAERFGVGISADIDRDVHAVRMQHQALRSCALEHHEQFSIRGAARAYAAVFDEEIRRRGIRQ